MISAKIISSLDKVLPSHDVDSFQSVRKIRALKGERVHFQVVLSAPLDASVKRSLLFSWKIRSGLSRYLKAFSVGLVPVEMPIFEERSSGDFISTDPGLYPDVLTPLSKRDTFYSAPYRLKTFWITLELPVDLEPGDYPVYVSFLCKENALSAKAKVIISVADSVMPENDMIFTQWMHCDCIADYHRVKIFSEAHWRLIESYIKTAAHTGINMLLTPVFTPPLDTAVGTYRKTVQLVKVIRQNGTYRFDFSLLDRWITLCRKYGIRYFEIAHLFTQWGAKATPKICAVVDGKEERIFGWDVPSDGPEYIHFLSCFLPALCEFLKKNGVYENCYFHISDEPRNAPDRPDFQNYKKAKAIVKKFLPGVKMMDALSDVEFFDNGLVETPVPATNHIEAFLQREIPERWCYYCCTQGQLVSNRFISMPSFRNRVSGIQFYRYQISGFLHWGYNFYYDRFSIHTIDPYRVTDANHNYPSGDTFSVYPAKDGPLESIRTAVFYQGLQDRMILKALERKIGREAVIAFLEEIAGRPIRFDDCLDREIVSLIHDRAIDLLVSES